MKSPLPANNVADHRISALCFALPLVFSLSLIFLQNTVAETLGVWGLGLCLLASPLALLALLFKLPRRTKHALKSFLVGFVLAVGMFAVGAYINLSGQQSPW